MTLDAARTLTATVRRSVCAIAIVSGVMLAVCMAVRISPPSSIAPRVNIRWADGISDAQRLELERTFALSDGEHREGTTWQYGLTDLRPSSIRALLDHPAVRDTQNIDRSSGEVVGAPAGMTRLVRATVTRFTDSLAFDWFTAFWIASLAVSSTWLAST